MPSTIQTYHAANSPVTTGRKSTSWSHILRGTNVKWHALEWAEFFWEDFGLDSQLTEKGRSGPILCISYTSRAFGSITLDMMKIDDLICERLFRLLNNPVARSMVKTPESCTTDGTTQMIDQAHVGYIEKQREAEDCNDFITSSSHRTWQGPEDGSLCGRRMGAAEWHPSGLPSRTGAAQPCVAHDQFACNCGRRLGGQVRCSRKENSRPDARAF
jgi:hypothetical protein